MTSGRGDLAALDRLSAAVLLDEDAQPAPPRRIAPGKVTLTSRIHRRATAPAAQDPGPIVLADGSPLPRALRGELESALGVSLDAVRVHTDGNADRAARALGATAFAIGPDIGFRAGAYDPASRDGVHLIAHEVAHTTQRHAAGARVSEPDDPAEREADAFADRFTRSRGVATADAPVDRATPSRGATAPDAPIHRAAAQPGGDDDARTVAAFDARLQAALPALQEALESELVGHNALTSQRTGPWVHVKALALRPWDSAKALADRPRWIIAQLEVHTRTLAIVPVDNRQRANAVLFGIAPDGTEWPAQRHGPDAIQAVDGPIEYLFDLIALVGGLRAIGRAVATRLALLAAEKSAARAVAAMARRGSRELDRLLGEDIAARLVETLSNGEIKKLRRDLGTVALRRLAADLSGAEIAALVARLHKQTVRRLATDLSGAELQRLAQTLGDDVVRGLAEPLGARGLAQLGRLEMFRGKFDPAMAAALGQGRGAAARALPALSAASSAEVQATLRGAGFKPVGTDADGMQGWLHTDGSLVRVKWLGAPAGKINAGRPHLVKEILKPGKADWKRAPDAIAKVAESGEVIPKGGTMAGRELGLWFARTVGREPTAGELRLLLKVWGDAGHIGIAP